MVNTVRVFPLKRANNIKNCCIPPINTFLHVQFCTRNKYNWEGGREIFRHNEKITFLKSQNDLKGLEKIIECLTYMFVS